MAEKPILFSGEMVRAILAERKTQTRRVVKRKDGEAPLDYQDGMFWFADGDAFEMSCPYGQNGDRLWVRETLRMHGYFGFPLGEMPQKNELGNQIWSYAADEVPNYTGSRPSIHMPRWASRITLEITGVRVERVQEISEKDAMDEGAGISLHEYPQWDGDPDCYRKLFRERWNALNAKREFGWDVDPWVWVIEFKKAVQP